MGSAQAADEDWPDRIEYPHLPKPPQPIKQQSLNQGEKGESKLKKLWPFKKDPQKAAAKALEKQPPPSEEQITKVGPRLSLPSPDPLLRLPLPIKSDEGIIPAGFYLVHLTGGDNNQPRNVMLIQKNKAVLRFAVQSTGTLDDENKAETGTSSPIKKLPQAPASPGLKAEIKLTPDQKGLIIVVKNDQERFESEAFPVTTDQRHVITY